MRAPVSHIQILMPVWGERYIRQFFDFCLPSLLAEGNLPALRRRAPCAFTFFTRAEDGRTIRGHPLLPALESLCAVEIEPIDDLISDSPSTIITIAYASGVRSAGAAALQTSFIFLVADYVFADGALDNAVAPIFAGSSGVLVGNFQACLEEVGAFLRSRPDAARLSIEPRSLVRLAMEHLHPSTIANFADDPLRSDPASNRLFWRVGDGMIGRFYLMHMIAIRPETTDFAIAAPSDYAFIPELCPSGAVTTIDDSDEYCVIELQPQRHAASTLELGPLEPHAFATSLRTWATEQHRKNARRPLVFHSEQLSVQAQEAIARSQRFVDAVERALPAAAQPHRHHPYWSRQIDHHVRTAMLPVDFRRLQEVLGDPTLAAYRSTRAVRFRAALLGHAPNVRPWHPRWPDSRGFWDRFAGMAKGSSALLVGALPAALREGLDPKARTLGAREVAFAPLDEFGSSPQGGEALRRFDLCALVLPSARLADCWRIIETCGSALRADGRMLVAIGDVFEEAAPILTPDAIPVPPAALMRGWRIEAIGFTPASGARILIQSAMMEAARSSLGGGRAGALAAIARAAALAALSAAFNWRALRRSGVVRSGECSSVFLNLRRAPEAAGSVGAASAR
jgi:hypothetical protein